MRYSEMKNRIVLAFSTVLILLSAFALTAQEKKDRGNKQSIKILEVKTIFQETPRVLIDNVTISHSKKDKKNARNWWVEIRVLFTPARAAAKTESPWLENVQAEIEMLYPMVNDKQRLEWGVFKGSATLSPILADGDEHVVRFFVPPHIIYRYCAFREKNFQKLVDNGLPVLVLFRVGGDMVYGGRGAGSSLVKVAPEFPGKIKIGTAIQENQRMFDFYRENTRSFFPVENAIVPASKTPWAWLELDDKDKDAALETTIDDQQRGR